jgi:hypothetical protein
MKDKLTKKITEALRAELKAKAAHDKIERVISCQLSDYPTTDMMVPPQPERKGPARHWPQAWEIFSWAAAVGILSATFLSASKSHRTDCPGGSLAVGRSTTTFDAGFWFPPSNNISTGVIPLSPVLPFSHA